MRYHERPEKPLKGVAVKGIERCREPAAAREFRAARLSFRIRDRFEVDCVVKNLNEHGACVHVRNCASIPDRFDLMLSPGSQPRACRVLWRSEGYLGIAFVDHFADALADGVANVPG